MRRQQTLLLLVLICISLVTACGRVSREIVLEPVQMGTKTKARADRTGACFGLDRTPILPTALIREPGQIGVGHENTFLPGADPVPCNHRRNYSHQAAVLFDLSELTRLDAIVTEAVLETRRRLSFFTEGVSSKICRMRLERATEAWANGDFTGPINASDPRAEIQTQPLPVPGDTRLTSFGVDREGISRAVVTGTVQRWHGQAAPRIENHGFVFMPQAQYIFTDSTVRCGFVLSDMRLRVNVLVEPRP